MRFSQDARQKLGNRIAYTAYDTLGRVTRVGAFTGAFSSLDPDSAYAFETDNASWRSRVYCGGARRLVHVWDAQGNTLAYTPTPLVIRTRFGRRALKTPGRTGRVLHSA